MPDSPRDANIERLFAKIDNMRETVTATGVKWLLSALK